MKFCRFSKAGDLFYEDAAASSCDSFSGVARRERRALRRLRRLACPPKL